MKFKSTWIIAIIAVALVAYAYFVSYKGKEKAEKEKSESAKLFDWKAEDVASIQVDGTQKFEFVRGEGSSDKADKSAPVDKDAWTVIAQSPVIHDLGDSTSINGFLNNVLDAKSEEVVAEGADVKLDLFGFKDGQRRVALKNKAGVSRALSIGTETGVAGKRFGRINDENKVHLMEGAVWNQLDRGINDFRDKALFHKVVGDVQKFHLVNRAEKNKGDTVIEKKGDKWEASNVPDAKIDAAAVERLFSTLHENRATELVDKDPSAATRIFGLSKPAQTLTINFVGGAQSTIELSAPIGIKPDGKKETTKVVYNYAKVSGRSPIFVVGANVTENLTKNLNDFRDKSGPFQFKTEGIEIIDVKTPLADVHLKKQGDKWVEVTPADSREVDQAEVQNLFTRMKDQRVNTYLGSHRPATLEPVKGHYIFKDKEGKIVFELKWGANDKTNQSPAQTSTTPEYFTVDAALINTVPAKTLVKEKKPITKPATPQGTTQVTTQPSATHDKPALPSVPSSPPGSHP